MQHSCLAFIVYWIFRNRSHGETNANETGTNKDLMKKISSVALDDPTPSIDSTGNWVLRFVHAIHGLTPGNLKITLLKSPVKNIVTATRRQC